MPYPYILCYAAVELCEAVPATARHSERWAPQVHQVCDPESLRHCLHGLLSGAFCSAQAPQVQHQDSVFLLRSSDSKTISPKTSFLLCIVSRTLVHHSFTNSCLSCRWWQFYYSLFFSGHVVFAGWPLYAPAVKALIKAIGGQRIRSEKDKDKDK